jgi:hypothetical protein
MLAPCRVHRPVVQLDLGREVTDDRLHLVSRAHRRPPTPGHVTAGQEPTLDEALVDAAHPPAGLLEHSHVRPSLAWPSLAWPSLAWPSLAFPVNGSERLILVR